jgi:hypothetical protein
VHSSTAPTAQRLSSSSRIPSPAPSKSARRNPQSRKIRRRGSVAIERRFLNRTKDLHRARIGAPTTGSSVEYHTLTAPISTPSIPQAVNDNEDAAHGRKLYVATKPRRPDLWRDISIKAKTTYIFREIEAAHGSAARVFTLRIDPKLLENRPNPADYMRRRIHDALKKEFGRNISVAGVLEWRGDTGNELHIHGVVGGINDNDEERARAALRAAGGDWREGRANGVQAVIEPVDASRSLRGFYGIDGWAEYCCKDIRATEAELDQRRRARGDVYLQRAPRVDFASREIQQAAKKTYERDRAKIIGDTKNQTVGGVLSTRNFMSP